MIITLSGTDTNGETFSHSTDELEHNSLALKHFMESPAYGIIIAKRRKEEHGKLNKIAVLKQLLFEEWAKEIKYVENAQFDEIDTVTCLEHVCEKQGLDIEQLAAEYDAAHP